MSTGFQKLSVLAATAAVMGLSMNGDALADAEDQLNVSATVPTTVLSCTLGEIGPIEFDEIPEAIPGTGIRDQGTINFTCNDDTSIVVEILGDVTRTLNNGTGTGNDTLSYILFQPDGATAWGEDDQSSEHITTVTDGVQKTLDVIAEITGGQPADSGTTYADAPTVRVNF